MTTFPFDNVDLKFVRRDTWKKYFTFKQNGAAFDTTGCHLWFTVKENTTDADVDAIVGPFDFTITSVTNGQFLWLMPKTETDVEAGTYYFDYQLVDTNGYVTTVLLGRVKVLQDITIQTA